MPAWPVSQTGVFGATSTFAMPTRRLVVPLAPGDYDIIDRGVIDEAEGWCSFCASPDDATQRHLSRMPIAGPGAAERIQKRVFAEIICRDLEGWSTDEECRPTDRTFRLFKEWFEIEHVELVEDVGCVSVA